MHIALDSSTQVSTRKERSAPLDPQVADRLLDLLSTDDAFRKLFAKNPCDALASIGFRSSTDVPSPTDCFWEIRKLASKEQIAGARTELQLMLTSGLNYTTPKLDTGLKGGHRLRS